MFFVLDTGIRHICRHRRATGEDITDAMVEAALEAFHNTNDLPGLDSLSDEEFMRRALAAALRESA